jgi:hypothetical protein
MTTFGAAPESAKNAAPVRAFIVTNGRSRLHGRRSNAVGPAPPQACVFFSGSLAFSLGRVQIFFRGAKALWEALRAMRDPAGSV